MMNKIIDILSHIKNNRIYLKSVRYEYRHNNLCLHRKPQGTLDYALSEAYYETIRKELDVVEEIVQKLSTVIQSNFKVDIKVLPNGKFDFDHVHIQVSRSFVEKDSNGKYPQSHALMVHDTLFNILVFADCIHDVHLYSTNYRLSHCEVFLVTDMEDLLYMMENISIPNKCFEQWNHAIKQFQQFTRNHYACSMNIPCDEGELSFENSVYGLSQKEFMSTM